MFQNKTMVITGSAGFIGSNLTKRLLLESDNCAIVGYDNCNDYYDPALKEYRLAELSLIKTKNKYKFIKGDLADKTLLESLFQQ